VDKFRILPALEGLIENKECHHDQRQGIDKSNQHSGAAIAISLGRTGRTPFKIDREQREQERKKIRKVMPRFRKQCKRMGANSGRHEQDNVKHRRDQRDPKHSPGLLRMSVPSVDVHTPSLRVRQRAFKRPLLCRA